MRLNRSSPTPPRRLIIQPNLNHQPHTIFTRLLEPKPARQQIGKCHRLRRQSAIRNINHRPTSRVHALRIRRKVHPPIRGRNREGPSAKKPALRKPKTTIAEQFARLQVALRRGAGYDELNWNVLANTEAVRTARRSQLHLQVRRLLARSLLPRQCAGKQRRPNHHPRNSAVHKSLRSTITADQHNSERRRPISLHQMCNVGFSLQCLRRGTAILAVHSNQLLPVGTKNNPCTSTAPPAP
jgi:hypothetical protein